MCMQCNDFSKFDNIYSQIIDQTRQSSKIRDNAYNHKMIDNEYRGLIKQPE